MAENQQVTSSCPACGKPTDGQPCCSFGQPDAAQAIEVVAEIITSADEHFPINTRWLRIGRDESNDIVLTDDTYVSRFHAWITYEQERFWVEDLGSTNGTMLNGARLKRRELLASGDKIKIGESEMTFALLDKTG